MYVVKANIKNAAPKFSISSDFAEALNTKVENLIIDASKRAQANGRRTVMVKDL